MLVRELVTKLGFKVDHAKIKSFNSAIDTSKSKALALGKALTGVGKSMTKYVTLPILGMGALALKNWDEQAKAIAAVETALKSTGNRLGFTIKQLSDASEEIQANSLFPDEQVLQNVSGTLLSFANIAKDNFFQIQQAVVDVAAKTQSDLKSTSVIVGKIFNDPVKNLNALSRKGIQFSKQEEDRIKQLVKSNKLYEAQKLILDKINTIAGGQAAAQMAAGMGPWKNLMMQYGDVLEEFGDIIAQDILKPLLPSLRAAVKWFKELSPAVKKTIIYVAGFVALIGPLLVAIGSIAVIFTVVSLKVLGIVALVVAAILGLIAHFIAIYLVIEDIYTYFQGGDSVIIPWAKGIWAAIKTWFVGAFDAASNKLMEFWGDTKTVFQSVGSYMVNTIKDAVFQILRLLDMPRQAMLKLLDMVGLKSKIEGLIGVEMGGEIDFLESKVNGALGTPQSVGASGSWGAPVENNNDYQMNQSVHVNVETNADPQKIGDEIKKQTGEFFAREMRKAGSFVEQGAG